MTLRHSIELGAYRLGTFALQRVPLPALQRAGAALARRAFDGRGKRVQWALTNLRIAFPDLPEEERVRIGRSSYEHFAWNVIDFVRSQRWTDQEIRSRVRFEGLEHVATALEQGRGAIGLTLHMGNFELANLAAPLNGLRVAAVARPMSNRDLYRRIRSQRARTGNVVIDRRSAARPILRSLRQNRVVGILNDQYMRRTRAVFVPLFGARCATSAGLATLALRARAPVIPFYSIRVGPDRHRACFESPLAFEPSGDLKADIAALTALSNQALERIIRSWPEQWMWGHRRFRHSPDLDGLTYA